MNHDLDYDRDFDRMDELTEEKLKNILLNSLEKENEMMRTYIMTAERIHDNDDLKHRLQNFSEGNAKRSQQLSDVLKGIE